MASDALRERWLPLAPAADRVAVRRLLLAGLGLVFTAAFASLAVQVEGLIGSRGILPAESFFRSLELYTAARFIDAPSVCWWVACGDAVLASLCAVGVLGGLALMVGAAPLPAAIACWTAYLSLFYAGQTFLSFQWDLLLLEAAFLAIFLAPARALSPRSPAWRRPPSRSVLFLFRWLLFRLVFSAGVVKLSSGDPVWRDLSALAYHYETQPIPTWTSWWAFQLPLPIQQLSVLGTFAVELLVPWLYFAPRPARLFAAASTAGFMGLIALTGNYGFFNLLAAVLCLSLLDDRVLPAGLRARLTGDAAPRRPLPDGRVAPLRTALALAGTGFLVLASLLPLGRAFRARIDWPAPIAWAYRAQAGLRLVSPYGLFATMTTRRPEILVEGSADGRTWRPYTFRWKPGDPMRAPAFTGLHMPRLDWQMWFAALSGPEHQRWFASFLRRLLAGEPAVLALLEADPFGGSPPRHVRATLYDYRFTDCGTRAETGAWWRRRRLHPYLELSADELSEEPD
jgi:hypothetical protein